MQKTASKKVINGWAMYDWANSVYNLVITTTLLAPQKLPMAVTAFLFSENTLSTLPCTTTPWLQLF